MAKTKTEKIASIEEQNAQLENQKKRLIQQEKEQERKDRTRRLCKRMGLFESLLPDTIPLTDEQFKTFLAKTVTSEHCRRTLDGLTAQNAATTAQESTETAVRDNHTYPAKPTETAQSGGHRRERKRGQRRKAERLTHAKARAPLYTTLAWYMRSADGVLPLSVQKEQR